MSLLPAARTFYRQIGRIAVPIALQNLITVSVGMMDTLMLGRLGSGQLAASSLANQVFNIFMVINFGIGSGAGVLTAQYWGRKDPDAIRRVMSVMYRVSVTIALVMMALSLAVPEAIIRIFNQEPQVVADGAAYLRIIALTYLPVGITLTSNGVLRTVGTVRVALVVYGVSFFVNVFFNWVFIFGNLGAPRLEVRGAALGTLLARLTEVVIVLVFLACFEKKIRFRLGDLRRTDHAISRAFRQHATPVVINETLWSTGAAVVAVVLGNLGSEVVAANSITTIVYQFVTIFIFGMSNAAGVLVGNSIGEARYDHARQQARSFVVLAVALGLLSSAVILLVRGPFVALYNIPASTQALASDMLLFMAAAMPFISVAIISMMGVLRGGGDVRFVMVADIVFLWLVAIPLGFVTAFWLHWPVVAVYAVLKCDELLKTLLAAWRLRRGDWIRDLTR